MIDPYSDDDDDDNVDNELAIFNRHQRRASRRGADADADPDPADADDDDDPDDADDDDRGGERTTRSRERTGVELVQLDDDDPTDLDIDPPSRRGRRAARGGLHAAYEGQIQQNARLQARLELLEQGQRGQQQADPDGDGDVEDLEADIEELEEKQERLVKSYEAGKANLSADEVAELRKEARSNERDLRDAQFEVNMKRHGLGKQQSASEVRQAALRAQFTTRNPDIYASEPARQLMVAKYQIARELRQEPDSMELHDRCCEEVREELRMEPRGGRGRPSDADRRQTSGVPRSGGHGRAGRRSVKMTDERKDMADIAFSHITDRKKRHNAWAQSVGASLVKHGEA